MKLNKYKGLWKSKTNQNVNIKKNNKNKSFWKQAKYNNVFL